MLGKTLDQGNQIKNWLYLRSCKSYPFFSFFLFKLFTQFSKYSTDSISWFLFTSFTQFMKYGTDSLSFLKITSGAILAWNCIKLSDVAFDDLYF